MHLILAFALALATIGAGLSVYSRETKCTIQQIAPSVPAFLRGTPVLG